MKKILVLTSIIILCLLCLTQGNCQPPSPEVFIQGIFVDAAGNEFKTDGDVENLVTKLRNDYFNTIFPQARLNGKVLYPSAFEPMIVRQTETFKDPMLSLIEKANPPDINIVPMQIYPWINLLEGYSADLKMPPFKEHILAKHNEWTMLNIDGNSKTNERTVMLDPLIPGAQQYLISILAELTQIYYKVPGIYLNDLSFPENGNNWGYNPVTVALYNKEKNLEVTPDPNDPVWSEWRRERMTEFLEKISKTLKTARPNLLIAVGILAEGDSPKTWEDFKNSSVYKERMQDLQKWLDKGIIDIIVLKNYFQGATENDRFEGWLKFINDNKKNASVIVAVDGRRNFSNSIIDQLRATKEAKTRGSVLNSYRQPARDSAIRLFATLKTTVFKENALTLKSSGIDYSDLPVIKPKIVEDKTTKTLIIYTPTPTIPPTVTPTPFPEIETPPEVTPTQVPGITPTPILKTTPKTQSALEPPAPPVKKWDKFYLKNGSMFEGKLIEEVDGVAIIENKDGFQIRIKSDEIEKIVQIID